MGGTFSAAEPGIRIIVGSLGLGFSFLTSWLALQWFFTRKTPLAGALAIFLAITGVVSLLTVYRYHTGWIAVCVLIIAQITSIWAIIKIWSEIRLTAILGVITITVACTLLPLSIYHFTQKQSYQQLTGLLDAAENTVKDHQNALAEKNTELSTDTAVVKVLQEGFTSDAAQSLQNLMVTNNLQNLTLFDKRGYVIVRAQNPTRNDNLVTTFGWLLPTLKGDAIEGTTYDEEGIPLVIAAAPVLKDSVMLGGILIGQSFEEVMKDAHMPRTLAVATLSGINSFSASSPVEVSLFNTAALDEDLRGRLSNHPNLPETFQLHLTLQGDRYRVVGSMVSTLTPNQPRALVTLNPDQQKQPSPFLLALAVGTSTAVVLVIIQYVLTRRRHRG